MDRLKSISPIDGRYFANCIELSPFFSEYALIRYRVLVEVEYFIALCKLPLPQLAGVQEKALLLLKAIAENFNDMDAARIKEIELTTNHDVKAVEYFLREQFDKINLGAYKEFIHFGLTSQDINNTALPMMMMHCMKYHYTTLLNNLLALLQSNALAWKNIPMLAYTHGQPASPTLLGKEIYVFYERLRVQLLQLENIQYSAKFGGATGNFNAHMVAYPHIAWHAFADNFVASFGLSRSKHTTQIEHYDNIAAWCDNLKRINTILIDCCRDIWAYISMNYFVLEVKAGEVGSSAMPHKVNPIDFENAEGNLAYANALYEFFAAKLPISRLQRDLTDSTVLRNIGVPVAHSFIAIKSIVRGLNKLTVNEKTLAYDLDNNWAVVAEAIQTILRRENYPNPYQKLKELTRGNLRIDEASIKDFISTLDVSDTVRKELQAVTPHNYTGVFNP